MRNQQEYDTDTLCFIAYLMVCASAGALLGSQVCAAVSQKCRKSENPSENPSNDMTSTFMALTSIVVCAMLGAMLGYGFYKLHKRCISHHEDETETGGLLATATVEEEGEGDTNQPLRAAA